MKNTINLNYISCLTDGYVFVRTAIEWRGKAFRKKHTDRRTEHNKTEISDSLEW